MYRFSYLYKAIIQVVTEVSYVDMRLSLFGALHSRFCFNIKVLRGCWKCEDMLSIYSIWLYF